MKRLIIIYHQERAGEPIFYREVSRMVNDGVDSVALAHRLLAREHGRDYTLDSIQEDLAAVPALESLFPGINAMDLPDSWKLPPAMRGAKEAV